MTRTLFHPSIIIFAILTACLGFAQQIWGAEPDNFEEDPYVLLCGQADKAIADGNFEEAAARLIDAMSVKPDSPSNVLLLSNLGMIYSTLDRDSLALATIDEVLRREPKMTAAHSNRARILLKMGRDKEAFDAFGTVIGSDSLNLDARYYHGMMALYTGQLDKAEADFKVLRSLAPETAETAAALSALYSMTGRDREAIPYFKSLISFDPAAEYYAGLAGCYLATGDLSEAGATIADGLKAYPNDPELYYYRAWLNRERLLYDDARADGQKAISLGASPRRVEALFQKKVQ